MQVNIIPQQRQKKSDEGSSWYISFEFTMPNGLYFGFTAEASKLSHTHSEWTSLALGYMVRIQMQREEDSGSIENGPNGLTTFRSPTLRKTDVGSVFIVPHHVIRDPLNRAINYARSQENER